MAKGTRPKKNNDRRATRAAIAERKRLKDARDAWLELEWPRQLEILRELLETRSEELKRAYRGIRSMAIGFGRTGAKRRIQRIPQITFVVARKLAESKVPKHGRARLVPRHLFAYCELDGTRRLCAVPTDVEDRKEMRFSTSGRTGVLATGGEQETTGAVCCVVKSPQNPQRLLAVGCHHVFGLSQHVCPVPADAFVALSDGTPLGIPSHFGFLGSEPPFSTDAGLCPVSQSVGLHLETGFLPSTGRFAAGVPELPALGSLVFIRPPRDVPPIPATVMRIHSEFDQPDDYAACWRPVIHRELVELALRAPGANRTKPGDSGCPVFDETMKILLGMHIAGQPANAGNHTLMIPTWEMLRPSRYSFSTSAEFFDIKLPNN